jgi:hypothetical protein
MNPAAALLTLVAVGASAPGGAQESAGAAAASVEALVAGAAACATRALSQDQMAERLAAAGWTAGAAREISKDMLIRSYSRQDVTLTYFTSKPMKQCVAKGAVAPDYDFAPLVAALAAHLGKQARVDAPGRRYLYALPRLDILTLQIKSDAAQPHVELSVVH